jgi:hypothetical protein
MCSLEFCTMGFHFNTDQRLHFDFSQVRPGNHNLIIDLLYEGKMLPVMQGDVFTDPDTAAAKKRHPDHEPKNLFDQ